ncbi:hypothetical protein A5636_23600 [Mycobacterium asiaticum]|uniref:Uncharacterized protein n=2 Tax=Mycobacterium asiaticum TaxID=1790 RepID=A0A1A3N5R4_MYCAS|nr:hypothetical protein A5636_23600 [Mycobacterium asiaticum]
MGPALTGRGFQLDEADDAVWYRKRPAWAVYYRGSECKLQVCWSAREGGIDFMLAPLNAPNEFGLINHSKKWRFMLALSEVNDGLRTPSPDAGPETWWAWRKALFDTHFEAAHQALLRQH